MTTKQLVEHFFLLPVHCPFVVETEADGDVEWGINDVVTRLLDGEIKTKLIVAFTIEEDFATDRDDVEEEDETLWAETDLMLIYKKGHYPRRKEITKIIEDWVKVNGSTGHILKKWN